MPRVNSTVNSDLSIQFDSKYSLRSPLEPSKGHTRPSGNRFSPTQLKILVYKNHNTNSPYLLSLNAPKFLGSIVADELERGTEKRCSFRIQGPGKERARPMAFSLLFLRRREAL